MTANFDSVKQHPLIELMGTDILEQGRINSFAVDLSHWLVGSPTDSLGLLARVTLMIVQDELESVRQNCIEQPEINLEAAAAITSELWPRLRTADQQVIPAVENASQVDPVLTLLRECSGLDVPELLYLTQRLEAELIADDSSIEPTAKILMRGIAHRVQEHCGHSPQSDGVSQHHRPEASGEEPHPHKGPS